MVEPPELSLALRPVIAELQRLSVRYYIGGSVASAYHGAGRSTLDVDLAAELDEATAKKLAAALSQDYYVSEAAAIDAVCRGSSFNVLHLATSFKVDLFVSRRRPFDLQVLERTVSDIIGDAQPIEVQIASAEDIILLKLEWYRLGDEVSERQWNDVLLVARLGGDRLDRNYLIRWGEQLGVADLLERLFAELNA